MTSGFDCVLAADRAGGIGKAGDLPWPRLTHDLRHFARLTTRAAPGRRNAVIMGRRTWESVPPRYRPLRDRLNVVISRAGVDVPDGVVAAASLEEALARAADAPGVDRRFVVGGGQIYQLAYQHAGCRTIYLTRIDAEYDCDTFAPAMPDGFTLAEVMGEHEDGGVSYRIERWTRPGADG